jgi:hypothetical protein
VALNDMRNDMMARHRKVNAEKADDIDSRALEVN